MSTFGERLNQWLIEQGRVPWPQHMLDALDKATAETLAEFQEWQERGERARVTQEGLCQQEPQS